MLPVHPSGICVSTIAQCPDTTNIARGHRAWPLTSPPSFSLVRWRGGAIYGASVVTISAIRVMMKKEKGTWSVSPACSLRKLNLDRACEGNGFDVCVCVCGYWWLYDGLVGRVILLKVLF